VFCYDFVLTDEPGVWQIHLTEVCFSDVATAHLSCVVTYKYGDKKYHGMTVQFRDSPRVHKFCPAICNTAYDPFFSALKKNMKMLPQLYTEPGYFSTDTTAWMLVCQHDASPHHQQWRHNIPKQGTAGSLEDSATVCFRPNPTVFVLLLSATLESWKQGRTPKQFRTFFL